MAIATNKGTNTMPTEDVLAMDKLVLATVNAPFKRNISAAKLQECIMQVKIGEWPAHIAAFFTDVSTSLVFRFAFLHKISESKLVEAYVAMRTETGERSPDLERELGQLVTSP